MTTSLSHDLPRYLQRAHHDHTGEPPTLAPTPPSEPPARALHVRAPLVAPAIEYPPKLSFLGSGRAYAAAWSVAGALAFGYLITVLWNPDAVSDLAMRSPDGGELHGLARTLSRTASDVAVLQRSVITIEADVARVRSQVAEHDVRERALIERVAQVETRVDKFAPALPLITTQVGGATKSPAILPVIKNARTETAKVDGRVVETGSRPIATGSIAPAAVVPARDDRPVGIHLAAGPSIDALRLSWSLLTDRHKTALKSLEPRVVAGEGGVYQLVAGPFPNDAQAVKICAGLRAKGVTCRPTEFKGEGL